MVCAFTGHRPQNLPWGENEADARCLALKALLLKTTRTLIQEGCSLFLCGMIELTNVVKTYDTGTKALNGISLKIDDGEFVFLVGPSGSGKSTIIKILTAEIAPTAGSVFVNGFTLEKIRSRSIPYLRRTLGVIFQDFRLIDKKSVYDNVAFAMNYVS